MAREKEESGVFFSFFLPPHFPRALFSPSFSLSLFPSLLFATKNVLLFSSLL